mmetsp:Transcript_27986/g.52503  ORF Transcript_27986/g.52503 Transcript_27986/m.52503 type:complete len:102 (-) Transcript_27986:127-432(-)
MEVSSGSSSGTGSTAGVWIWTGEVIRELILEALMVPTDASSCKEVPDGGQQAWGFRSGPGENPKDVDMDHTDCFHHSQKTLEGGSCQERTQPGEAWRIPRS